VRCGARGAHAGLWTQRRPIPPGNVSRRAAPGGSLAAVPIPFPIDAHLHTDLSPDADVPVDVYAALAREQGIAELAITDHVDFDPGDPAYDYAGFERRERLVRGAADRWSGDPVIRLGVEVTYERRLEDVIRTYLAGHRYDFVIGSVHPSLRNPMSSRESAAAWCAGKTHREAGAWYWDEIQDAIHSGLFDAIGHLDFVKRYMHEHLGPFAYEPHADIYDRALGALVDTGTALEVNTSGLRQAPAEPYPSPVVVERYRRLGGAQVTIGSDAHRVGHFAFGLAAGYRSIWGAGFRALAYRHEGDRTVIDLSRELASAVAAVEA
jgi:histidinol-phosphatase (PHP family)